MALIQNTFEGGVAGETITLANSGGLSGTDFDEIDNNGAVQQFSSTNPMHGNLCALVDGTATRGFFGWSGLATKVLSMRFYVKLTAAPSATTQIVTPRNSTNYIGGLNITTSRTLQVTVWGGASVFTSAALTLGTWYRVEISWAVGTTTTNGAIKFRLYEGDTDTVVSTFDTTTADLNTTNITWLRFGKIGTSGNLSMYWDSVGFDPATSNLLGKYVVSNVAPMANAGTGANDVEPGTQITLNGSASTDPDGTIASWAWSQTAGTTVTLSGTGASRTFTAPYTIAGTVLGFSLTATDNQGATDTSTVTFAVLACSERAVIGGVEVPIAPKIVVGGTLQ